MVYRRERHTYRRSICHANSIGNPKGRSPQKRSTGWPSNHRNCVLAPMASCHRDFAPTQWLELHEIARSHGARQIQLAAKTNGLVFSGLILARCPCPRENQVH
jgi:hypothetical protein